MATRGRRRGRLTESEKARLARQAQERAEAGKTKRAEIAARGATRRARLGATAGLAGAATTAGRTGVDIPGISRQLGGDGEPGAAPRRRPPLTTRQRIQQRQGIRVGTPQAGEDIRRVQAETRRRRAEVDVEARKTEAAGRGGIARATLPSFRGRPGRVVTARPGARLTGAEVGSNVEARRELRQTLAEAPREPIRGLGALFTSPLGGRTEMGETREAFLQGRGFTRGEIGAGRPSPAGVAARGQADFQAQQEQRTDFLARNLADVRGRLLRTADPLERAQLEAQSNMFLNELIQGQTPQITGQVGQPGAQPAVPLAAAIPPAAPVAPPVAPAVQAPPIVQPQVAPAPVVPQVAPTQAFQIGAGAQQPQIFGQPALPPAVAQARVGLTAAEMQGPPVPGPGAAVPSGSLAGAPAAPLQGGGIPRQTLEQAQAALAALPPAPARGAVRPAATGGPLGVPSPQARTAEELGREQLLLARGERRETEKTRAASRVGGLAPPEEVDPAVAFGLDVISRRNVDAIASYVGRVIEQVVTPADVAEFERQHRQAIDRIRAAARGADPVGFGDIGAQVKPVFAQWLDALDRHLDQVSRAPTAGR